MGIQRLGSLALLVAISAVAFLSQGLPANATFPGANGKIAFVRYEGGGSHIYVMNADGSQVTQLTQGSAYDSGPAWSPNGTKIAFSRASQFGGPGDIYVINADGGAVSQLTDGPDGDYDPAWSPNGTQIAFSSDRSSPGIEGIFVMNADGTNIRAVNVRSLGRGSHDPSWSPDGGAIAFYRGGLTSLPDICTVEVDSGWEENLTSDNSGLDEHPDWSPDGSKVVFESSREGQGGVYSVNADGSGLARIAGAAQVEARPAWSPDGRKIVFVGPGTSVSSSAVWIMNADGTDSTQLTGGSSQDTSPTWQPLASRQQGLSAPGSSRVSGAEARSAQEGVCAPAAYQGTTPTPSPGGLPAGGGPPSHGVTGVPYLEMAVILAGVALAMGGLLALRSGTEA